MKTIVAFDFDGTLTRKDSFIEFIRYMKGDLSFIISIPYLIILWISFKLGAFSRDYAKECVFRFFFKGMNAENFNNKCNKFSSKIDLILKEQSKSQIKKYVNNGYTVIIVSASVVNWIKPWSEKYGISHVIATQIEVVNNKLTGRFTTKNCRGKEKVNRILKQFPNKSTYRMIAYGNSIGDKEMLNFADKGYFNAF